VGLPNGLELSRPGRRPTSILAPLCLDPRQGIAPSSAMAPRERVMATSASPASILARRFRVGSSELLAGPGFNNPPAASEASLTHEVRSPRRARRRWAAERGGHARRGDGFLRRKGPPWMGRWAAASPLPSRFAPSNATAETAAPEGFRKKEDTGGGRRLTASS